LSNEVKPGRNVTLEIEGKGAQKRSVPLKLRIDTPIEIDYYRHGGILPYVLRQLLARK
jgi:aconitate hydratase